MEASYRIVPPAQPARKTASVRATSSAEYEVHDTLRHGLGSVASDLAAGHPLESHLRAYDQTQTQLKHTLLRRNEGIHMPLRLHMEQMLVRQPRRLPALPSSGFSADILIGRDTDIEPEDFMNAPERATDEIDVHGSMERALGMQPL